MKSTALTSLIAAIGSLAVLTSSAFAGEVVVDKNPPIEQKVEKWWSADLSFGYDSMYVFRGVSVLGTSASDGLIWTNLSGTYNVITNLSITTGVWWANSYNQSGGANYPGGFYNELDAYASVTYSAGPVDLSVGYIYYNYPYLAPGGLYDTHEITLGLAYTALPYVTPSLTMYYDCGRYQGWYGELRVDGEIPVYGDIITLNPSFWTSVDFGSVRKAFAGENLTTGAVDLGGTAGFNDIGVGLKAVIKVNEVISVSPYVKASFPIGTGTAINANYGQHFNGSSEKVWAGTNVTFSF